MLENLKQQEIGISMTLQLMIIQDLFRHHGLVLDKLSIFNQMQRGIIMRGQLMWEVRLEHLTILLV